WRKRSLRCFPESREHRPFRLAVDQQIGPCPPARFCPTAETRAAHSFAAKVLHQDGQTIPPTRAGASQDRSSPLPHSFPAHSPRPPSRARPQKLPLFSSGFFLRFTLHVSTF